MTDKENNLSIQEIDPNFASLTQETVHSSPSSIRVPDESSRAEDKDSLPDESTNHLFSTGSSVTPLETSQSQDSHDSLENTDEFEDGGREGVRLGTGEAETLSTTPVSSLSRSSNNRGEAHCDIGLMEEDQSMMSAGDLGAEELVEMAADLESNVSHHKIIYCTSLSDLLLHNSGYRHAIDSIHSALVKITPNTACYPTMTVLTVKMACESLKMPSLKPLQALGETIRGIIRNDHEFSNYDSLFDHPAAIYASFRDPYHIKLIEALLCAANDFLNPSPMDTVGILSALSSNIATTSQVARMVLTDFCPGITTNDGSNCIFNLERCSTLLEKLTQKDARADSSNSSRPSTQRHPESKATERRRSQGPVSASGRAGLSSSLVKFSGEMAVDAAKKARSTQHFSALYTTLILIII